MALESIWVICISYDYGVHDKAGYFTDLKSAEKWIEQEESNRKGYHDSMKNDWDEVLDGAWSEYEPTGFYVAELKSYERYLY